MVKLWREDLGKVNQKAAEALADPAQYKNLFPNMDAALEAERHQVRRLSLMCQEYSSSCRTARMM